MEKMERNLPVKKGLRKEDDRYIKVKTEETEAACEMRLQI